MSRLWVDTNAAAMGESPQMGYENNYLNADSGAAKLANPGWTRQLVPDLGDAASCRWIEGMASIHREENMQQLTIGARKSVRISAIRARAESSGFQLYYSDQPTNGCSALGPRAFVGQGGWSALLEDDPALAAKGYDWLIGLDLASMSGGSGPVMLTAQVNSAPGQSAFRIFGDGNEKSTVVLIFG